MNEQAQRGLRRHCSYSNVTSTLAVFLVIAGGTALAAALPRNSVKSPTVNDNSLRSKDLKDGKGVKGVDVNAAQVQLRVGESCPEGEAIRVINVSGGVACEADEQGAGGGPPSGSAGGDLTGTYPNPLIGPNAVGTPEIGANAVGSEEIADEAVDQADIATNAVRTGEIASRAVTGTELDAQASFDFDFGVFAANTCAGFSFAMAPAVDVGDAVIVAPPPSQPDNLIVQASADEEPNNVRLRVCNPSNAATADPPNASYRFYVIAP